MVKMVVVKLIYLEAISLLGPGKGFENQNQKIIYLKIFHLMRENRFGE